ncbi:hypothetical protein [Chlamydia felis Fe/C-56]|uniref:Uncharacterized protein n=1 Tax=Chlamydia felis (strain Fe/C-56) TaxID=264202 RepID=Q253L5_CHLFF|nr:hypothetical protein [Chlamydia felis]BAE81523.1 hypothetical protein [Chlamydia felis Fe/C-56]
MTNKDIKNTSIIYLKKFICNIVCLVDEFLESLEKHCKSLLSQEECDQALTLLIEELQKYKENLDSVAIDPSHPLNNLVKTTKTDLLK